MLPIQRSNLTLHKFGDQIVLHDEVNGKVHVLNEVAAFIWSQCSNGNTIDALKEAIRSEFQGLEDADLDNDIESTLREFSARNLVE